MPEFCLTNHIHNKSSEIPKALHTQRTIAEELYKCHLSVSPDNLYQTKNSNKKSLKSLSWGELNKGFCFGLKSQFGTTLVR